MATHIVDYTMAEMFIGDEVIYGSEPSQVCKILSFTEPDYDYDDEIQAPREFCPKVTVHFPDDSTEEVRTYNVTHITWADYPDGPTEQYYEASDLTRKENFND